jgi:hypothetical protein
VERQEALKTWGAHVARIVGDGERRPDLQRAA